MEKVVISVKWGLTLYIVNLFKLSLLPCNETEYTCKKYELLSEIWLRIVITKICVYFLLILKIFILKTLYIHAYTNAYIHIKTTGPSLCLTCNQLYLYFCNNGRILCANQAFIYFLHPYTTHMHIHTRFVTLSAVQLPYCWHIQNKCQYSGHKPYSKVQCLRSIFVAFSNIYIYLIYITMKKLFSVANKHIFFNSS